MLAVVKNPGEIRVRTGFLRWSEWTALSTQQNPPLRASSKIVPFRIHVHCSQINHAFMSKAAMSSVCTLHPCRWWRRLAKKENKHRWSPQHACATALAGLSSTKQSSSGSVDLHGAHFRRGNKYAGTYPAKMSTEVLIFADGAQIRARICAPVHVFAGGGGGNTLLHRPPACFWPDGSWKYAMVLRWSNRWARTHWNHIAPRKTPNPLSQIPQLTRTLLWTCKLF